MKKSFFITGATGLLGSSIAGNLLKKGNHICCLARSKGNKSAKERVVNALQFWDIPDPLAGTGQIKILEGDVESKGFGLDRSNISFLRDLSPSLIHCSACTSFDESNRTATFKTNLEGAYNLLELAIDINAHELNYISTGYVAGNTDKIFSEDDLDAGQEFNNAYEESKFEAEKLVRRFHERSGISLNIFRPSIIMGDSVSGKTSNFNGLYTYIRTISAIAKRHNGKSGNNIPVRLECIENVTKNIVPVDFISNSISAIALSEPSGAMRTYNLVNPAPPTFGWLNHTLHDILGLPHLKILSSIGENDNPLTKAERLLKNSISAYRPYLLHEPQFGSSITFTLLAKKGIFPPLTDRDYFTSVINYFMGRNNMKAKDDFPLIVSFENVMNSYLGKEIIPNLSTLTQEFVLTINDCCKNYRIKIEKGKLTAFDSNIPEKTNFKFITSGSTFESLLENKIRPQEAFFKKLVNIEGSIMDALTLSTVFEKFFQLFRDEQNAA